MIAVIQKSGWWTLMGRIKDQLCKNCWVCHKLAIPCPTTWWENILALKSCKVLPLYWVNYQKLDFHNGNALQNTNHIFVYERFLIFLYEILKNIKVSAAHLLIHTELLSCESLYCGWGKPFASYPQQVNLKWTQKICNHKMQPIFYIIEIGIKVI